MKAVADRGGVTGIFVMPYLAQGRQPTEQIERVLLNCRAGCDSEAIVAAVGLELHDLFPGEGGGVCTPRASVQPCNRSPAG